MSATERHALRLWASDGSSIRVSSEHSPDTYAHRCLVARLCHICWPSGPSRVCARRYSSRYLFANDGRGQLWLPHVSIGELLIDGPHRVLHPSQTAVLFFYTTQRRTSLMQMRGAAHQAERDGASPAPLVPPAPPRVFRWGLRQLRMGRQTAPPAVIFRSSAALKRFVARFPPHGYRDNWGLPEIARARPRHKK
jgi:hypothetical protein